MSEYSNSGLIQTATFEGIVHGVVVQITKKISVLRIEFFLDPHVILFFQKIFKYKIISSFHGNELERMQKDKTWNFKNLLYHKLLIASDYITGCSNFILDGLKASFPKVEPEKLKPILNGVSNQLLNTPLNLNRKEYFFSASRFIPKKGIDLLFKILLKLTSEKLYLAGGCKQDIDLMSLKLTSNIEILGKQEFKSVINYLTNAKVTLVTSKIEPYGIFVAEAIKIMNDNKIGVLVITNNKNEPIGITHIQDLLKAGAV